MTLSILIPTYNYNARVLVEELVERIYAEGVNAEVIVGDDGSTEPMNWLEELEGREGVRVLRFNENVGRARHLNRMAEQAEGEWMLIIDCDAHLESDFSLTAYIQAGLRAPVVCGGLRTPAVNPCPGATLRYKYECAADRKRSAAERNRHPYLQLSTFSLLIRHDVFMAIRFDENCLEYGYEDALFGVELQKRGIPILHIDNPLVHMGIEPNDVFLRKSETALRTLKRLNGRMQGNSHVENVANRLQRLHVAWAVRGLYRLFYQPMRGHLLGKHPSLTVFSFYKLGYYLSCF